MLDDLIYREEDDDQITEANLTIQKPDLGDTQQDVQIEKNQFFSTEKVPEGHLQSIQKEISQTVPKNLSSKVEGTVVKKSIENPVLNNFMATKNLVLEDSLNYEQKQLLNLEKQ